MCGGCTHQQRHLARQQAPVWRACRHRCPGPATTPAEPTPALQLDSFMLAAATPRLPAALAASGPAGHIAPKHTQGCCLHSTDTAHTHSTLQWCWTCCPLPPGLAQHKPCRPDNLLMADQHTPCCNQKMPTPQRVAALQCRLSQACQRQRARQHQTDAAAASPCAAARQAWAVLHAASTWLPRMPTHSRPLQAAQRRTAKLG